MPRRHERGRSLIDRARDRRDSAAETTEGLADLCEELLSNRGEASGVALAREILARYADLTTGPRIAFFETLATRFGTDRNRIEAAIEGWRTMPSDTSAAELHEARTPTHQTFGVRLPGPLGVEIDVQVPFGTSLKALPW